MSKTVILNRFALTFGTIFAAVLIWNIYVAANNDGIITGRVVTRTGAPVANASVSVTRKTLALSAPVGETTTDENGRFSFEGLDEYSIVLAVEAGGRSATDRLVRLWFKGQNITVSPPIVLQPAPDE